MSEYLQIIEMTPDWINMHNDVQIWCLHLKFSLLLILLHSDSQTLSSLHHKSVQLILGTNEFIEQFSWIFFQDGDSSIINISLMTMHPTPFYTPKLYLWAFFFNFFFITILETSCLQNPVDQLIYKELEVCLFPSLSFVTRFFWKFNQNQLAHFWHF